MDSNRTARNIHQQFKINTMKETLQTIAAGGWIVSFIIIAICAIMNWIQLKKIKKQNEEAIELFTEIMKAAAANPPSMPPTIVTNEHKLYMANDDLLDPKCSICDRWIQEEAHYCEISDCPHKK